jgi:hypothetical protein
MELTGVFLGLGQDAFPALLRSVSMGKLRTYQLFERVKTRARVAKLNSENLRKAAPRLWARLEAGEMEVAQDLAQAILVSNLDLIVAVLDFVGIPHEDGFFAKDLDAKDALTEGWQGRVYEKFKDAYPSPLLLFYINHLGWELLKLDGFFRPDVS